MVLGQVQDEVLHGGETITHFESRFKVCQELNHDFLRFEMVLALFLHDDGAESLKVLHDDDERRPPRRRLLAGLLIAPSLLRGPSTYDVLNDFHTASWLNKGVQRKVDEWM